MRMIRSMLSLMCIPTMFALSMAAKADELETIDLRSYADNILGATVAVSTTEDDFIHFSAVMLKLIQLIDSQEGWGEYMPYDLIVAISAPNIIPGNEPPLFLSQFRTESLAEVAKHIHIIPSECSIYDETTSSGERVLLILATASAENSTSSLSCLVHGLANLRPANIGPSNEGSIRNGLIDILTTD